LSRNKPAKLTIVVNAMPTSQRHFELTSFRMRDLSFFRRIDITSSVMARLAAGSDDKFDYNVVRLKEVGFCTAQDNCRNLSPNEI
jgi:hypothetical protein